MQRDGVNNSLWQFTLPAYTSKHIAIPNRVFDVLIVGGGITGVSTALQLQKAGKSCVLLEAYNLCYGTTGGTTAHLNTLIDTSYTNIEKYFGENSAQLVFQATSDAINLFKKNTEEYNIDCSFRELPGYLFAHDKKQTEELLKSEDAMAHAGLSIQEVKSIPVPISFDRAIEIAGQGQVHPTRYVYGIAQAFEAAGGVIVQNCFVRDVDEKEDMLHAQTSLGLAKAKNVVYATHIPPHINILDTVCAPYRSYALAVQLKDDNYPDAVIYDMDDPYHYYRTQEVLGKKYLVVGGEDHKTGHVENTEACFLNLESYVRKYYAVDSVVFKWSSQYYEPADGLPYIGDLPGFTKNMYVATGFSGNGITYSHVAAIVLTDLITKGNGKYTHLFSPKRIKPVAGFSNFVKENVDVAVQFFGKRLSREKIQELAEIAPGEGRVVKYEGEAIALYKDEHGGLHALNPICSHMKCEVSWNVSEKSWDCPCHGARYDMEGNVITGPATKGLSKIELEDLVAKE